MLECCCCSSSCTYTRATSVYRSWTEVNLAGLRRNKRQIYNYTTWDGPCSASCFCVGCLILQNRCVTRCPLLSSYTAEMRTQGLWPHLIISLPPGAKFKCHIDRWFNFFFRPIVPPQVLQCWRNTGNVTQQTTVTVKKRSNALKMIFTITRGKNTLQSACCTWEQKH